MRHVLICFSFLLILFGCARSDRPTPLSDPFIGGHYKLGKPYRIKGVTYYPKHDPAYDEIGIASWYGDAFHAKETANGEIFDKSRLTAAHKTLALPSYVRVTNLKDGRSVELRVNDRGPFAGNRIIDVSEAAAVKLGFRRKGLARVRVQYLTLAEASGTPPVAASSHEAAHISTKESCSKASHFVQIGAFANAERARTLVAKASSFGFLQARADRNETSSMFRVRVGPFDSLTDAQKSRIRLQAHGFRNSFMIQRKESGLACS